ncbi:MAG: GHKL domain-containing protein [Lachnospiraceae bacterium]|nr:GHKL domain-containing protein [Lachnospiraceae bacterium]
MNNHFRMALLLTLGMIPVGVFCRALSCLIEIRREWKRRLLLVTGSFLLIYMVIFTGDPVNFTCAILFFLFCMWIVCNGTRLKRLTIGLMLASTILALNGLFDSCIAYYLPDDWGEELYDLQYLVFRLASTLFLYLCIHHYRPEQDFELSPSLWQLLLLLCIPPLGIVFSLVMFAPYNMAGAFIGLYSALFLVAVFAFVGIIGAVFVLNRHQKLERENALASYNQKYYEAMELQQFEIRRLKHDLANHLQMIQSLPAAEKDSYIQQMIENPAFEKVLVYSGDATVNAVLTAKERMMRQQGISFCAKVDIPNELPFEKPDICALFANALDNAAEGCAALDTGRRQVELTARAAKGILALEIRNSFVEKQEIGAAQLIGGLPKTTKTDSANHGFGLRSIQTIVKKYGGTMELRQENEWFCLFCYLTQEESLY